MKKHILAIDDEIDLLEILKVSLSRIGYVVDLAANGVEAIERLKENSYDFIICDINMPGGLSGIDVLKYVQENNLEVHFTFLTGHGKGTPELKEAESSGVAILNKPTRIGQLVDHLKEQDENQTTEAS